MHNYADFFLHYSKINHQYFDYKHIDSLIKKEKKCSKLIISDSFWMHKSVFNSFFAKETCKKNNVLDISGNNSYFWAKQTTKITTPIRRCIDGISKIN